MYGTILIVEDSSDTRDMLVIALTAEGYAVKATETLYGALRVLAEDADIVGILLDYNLPGMPIENFLNEARKSNPKAGIVLMSAVISLEQRAARLGIRHYISKPLDFEKLRQLMKESMNGTASL